MKNRNKIANVVLFLAALAVGFDAQSGWSSFGTLALGYTQCDIATGIPADVGGIVVLQDGTVLVANRFLGIYSFKPGTACLPYTVKQLSNQGYLGMAIGLDGQVYANEDKTGDVVTVSPITGLPTSTVLKGVYGLGMALDPVTGDLYVTRCTTTACGGSDIRKISGLYGALGGPQIGPFVDVPGAGFDGLAWSCDGTRLVAASLDGDQSHKDHIFQFDRLATYLLDLSVPGTRPDGVVFGAGGTPFEGYFFVNNADKTVTKWLNDGTHYELIASGGNTGDFVSVDTNGNLLLTQADHITRLSTGPGGPGGQWVLPGSTLCSDLHCGANAATTRQVDYHHQACLSGLDANLVLTLSQSACGCGNCDTLNQARSTLADLLKSLDPPATCLDSLKTTVTNLYLSSPCRPCPECTSPLGLNLESGTWMRFLVSSLMGSQLLR